MTDITRIKNDMTTMGKRDIADSVLSHNRDKNDALTQERRFKADKSKVEKRLVNDIKTAERRDIKDGNKSTVFALAFVLLVVAISAYLILV